ncbi:DUF2341 domain-containing protein [Nanoarchaeota archaeon NZ13-N]|nr:MAG: DUF2341 domain-containing protein [Nanoarchaeota archaeon NZ13-N]
MRGFEEVMYAALALMVSVIVAYIFISNINFPTYSVSKPIESMKTSLELVDYGIVYPNTLVIYLRPTSPVNISNVIIYINRQKAIVKKIGNTPGDIVDPNKGDLIMVSLDNFQGNSVDIFVSGYNLQSRSFSINLEEKKPITPTNIATYFYRIPITIKENSGNNLTDYQVNVIVNTQNLILQGKMRYDCGDIRFTYVYPNGTEVKIPYWIESGCNTQNTKIWVKVPSIPANRNATIYIYYGNPFATSESNPNSVFIYFDTFDDLSKWSTYRGSSCTSINIYNFNGNNVVGLSVSGGTADSRTWCIIYNLTVSLPSSFKIDVDVYTDNIVDTLPYFNSITGPFYVFRFDARGSYYDLIGYYPAGATSTQVIASTSIVSSKNIWYHMQIIRFSNGTWYLYKGGDLYSLGTLEASVTHTTTTSGYLGLTGDGATGTTYFDNLIVRKYTSPEPSVSLGNEETTFYYPS